MRAYHLGPGHVTARDAGAAGQLVGRHLLRCEDPPPGNCFVEVTFVDVARGEGVVVRTRRGRALVVDGDPVRVSWPRRMTSMQPLIVAAELAAVRHGGRMIAGGVAAWGNRATLITGFSGTGKTGALLAAAREGGAEIAGTEWSWFDVATATAWPLPQPLRIRPHHLDRMGTLGGALGRGQRARLRAARRLPARLRRRVFVDVPMASVSMRRVDPVTVDRVVVIGEGDPPPIAGVAVIRVASWEDARIDW